MHPSLTPEMQEVLNVNDFKATSPESFFAIKKAKKINVKFDEKNNLVSLLITWGTYTTKFNTFEFSYLSPVEFQTLINLLTR